MHFCVRGGETQRPPGALSPRVSKSEGAVTTWGDGCPRRLLESRRVATTVLSRHTLEEAMADAGKRSGPQRPGWRFAAAPGPESPRCNGRSPVTTRH